MTDIERIQAALMEIADRLDWGNDGHAVPTIDRILYGKVEDDEDRASSTGRTEHDS